MLKGTLDKISETEVTGWIADDAAPDKIISCDLLVDGVLVRQVWADLCRPDLRDAGYGEGHHGFVINPRALVPTKTLPQIGFMLKPVGYDEYPGLSGSVFFPSYAPEDKLGDIARDRWTRDEWDEGLTWGARMSGDTFVDIMQEHGAFSATSVLVEIGPGYGRLLETILHRGLPFQSFAGIELSEQRVRKLTRKFAFDKRIAFVAEDAARADIRTNPTVIFSSSTFEHLHPDCSATLRGLSSSAAVHAKSFIDFLYDDDGAASGSMFAPNDGHYARKYGHDELRAIHEQAGLTVVDMRRFSIGNDIDGNEVPRLMVVAGKS
jgi:hypothetical protein